MSAKVAVVILAGGEGRRIGGNKPLKKLGGIRLIDRALENASRWSDVVAISVREAEQAKFMDARILVDDPGIAGPLAAIASALRFAREEGNDLVLTIPVDMPFLPADLCNRLMAGIGDLGCAIASSGGRLHPVCGLWSASTIGQLPTFLCGERRSLKAFATLIGFRPVDWAAAPFDPFFNVNTKKDLAQAELLASA